MTETVSLMDAAAAYAKRFGEGAPGYEFTGHPDLPAQLMAAVQRGEKLTEVELARRLGMNLAPPGAMT